MTLQILGYRVRLKIAVERDLEFTNTKRIFMQKTFFSLNDASKKIHEDLQYRLRYSGYFRSQKRGYDLVFYDHEANYNTYLAYAVVPIKFLWKKKDRTTIIEAKNLFANKDRKKEN